MYFKRPALRNVELKTNFGFSNELPVGKRSEK